MSFIFYSWGSYFKIVNRIIAKAIEVPDSKWLSVSKDQTVTSGSLGRSEAGLMNTPSSFLVRGHCFRAVVIPPAGLWGQETRTLSCNLRAL